MCQKLGGGDDRAYARSSLLFCPDLDAFVEGEALAVTVRGLSPLPCPVEVLAISFLIVVDVFVGVARLTVGD